MDRRSQPEIPFPIQAFAVRRIDQFCTAERDRIKFTEDLRLIDSAIIQNDTAAFADLQNALGHFLIVKNTGVVIGNDRRFAHDPDVA